MSTTTANQIIFYQQAVRIATSKALKVGLNVSTNPTVDTFVKLPDPITTILKEQPVTVSYSTPVGVLGKVWLNLGAGTLTFNQFLVYTTAWRSIAPSDLVYNPITFLNTTATGQTVNQTSTLTTASGSVTLNLLSNRYQEFSTTFTGNVTVTLPNTGLIDGFEFYIVRNAATPGAFTLTVTDPITNRSYVIPANTKGFVQWRCKGSSGWLIHGAGTYA